MILPSRSKKEGTFLIPLANLDPVTCRQIPNAFVDDSGVCTMHVGEKDGVYTLEPIDYRNLTGGARAPPLQIRQPGSTE